MEPGEIRRDDQHPFARAKTIKGVGQPLAQTVQGQLVGYGTAFVIQHKCNLFYTTRVVTGNGLKQWLQLGLIHVENP
jgi:hypothetical protein